MILFSAYVKNIPHTGKFYAIWLQLRGAHRALSVHVERTLSHFTLDVVSHLIGSSRELFHNHLHSHPWCTLFDSLLPLYFYLFFLVSFLLLLPLRAVL